MHSITLDVILILPEISVTPVTHNFCEIWLQADGKAWLLVFLWISTDGF